MLNSMSLLVIQSKQSSVHRWGAERIIRKFGIDIYHCDFMEASSCGLNPLLTQFLAPLPFLEDESWKFQAPNHGLVFLVSSPSLWASQQRRGWQDDMVGCHHQLNEHEFEQGLGVGDGQGGLECCSPWSCKESDKTEWLNWPEVNWIFGIM